MADAIAARLITIDPIAFTGELSERLLEDHNEIPTNWKLNNWMKVVDKYSSRELSKTSDKLPALAALARIFDIERQADAKNYCAGLWKEDLPMQLLWRRVNFKDHAKAKDRLIQDIENSNPSWSWASMRGIIEHYPYPPIDRKRVTLEIIDCHIVLKHQVLPYGEVDKAKLILKGYLRKVHWDGHALYCSPLGCKQSSLCNLLLNPVFDRPTQSLPGPVWLLHIYKCPLNHAYGIILKRIRYCSDFKRVGYFEVNLRPPKPESSPYARSNVTSDSLEEAWLESHRKQRITII
jgi:hypothetical protein